MAKVPTYERLDDGDVPGMSPPFYRFMDHIQSQVYALSQALNAGLTVADNFLADPVRVVALLHGVWSPLKLTTLKTAPTGVIVLHSDITVTGFQWAKVDQGRIRVRALFEGAPTDPVATTLEIRG